MGYDIYQKYSFAKDVFDEVDSVLGFKLSNIIFGDDETQLKQTENTQPALMAVSIAILKTICGLTNLSIDKLCDAVCGHSLGEYSALCATNAISLSDAAKTLYARGLAMKNACPNNIGGMIAIIGATEEQINDILFQSNKFGIIVLANDNSTGQVVLSGEMKAIDASVEIAANIGIKKAIKLPVSGAFHSPLMQKAKDEMIVVLDQLDIKKPVVPIICNVTAELENDPIKIKSLLADQITGTVRFRESIINMEKLGFTQANEIGAKNVLCGLIKRTSQNINAIHIENIEQIEEFMIKNKII
jgi:[acyl-carrier-protein] S-malonyltransferase